MPVDKESQAQMRNDAAPAPARRVGFLFNHDQLHQIAHSAPIAFALSQRDPAIDTVLVATNEETDAYLKHLARAYPGHRCRFMRIGLGPMERAIARIADRVAPYSRIAALRANVAFFRQFDALIVPEMTALMLKTRFGLNNLLIIHTEHGAGDRAISFDAANGKFDLLLLPGRKFRDRMAARAALDEGTYRIVGYPKFDMMAALKKPRPPLFPNARPTVLYNPHGSPHVSSWYAMGRKILEFFYDSEDYNLIFAPHIMLFERKFQISIDKFSFGRPGRIPRRFHDCPYILIDTGSTAAVDMTYTNAADIYLGDMSSQVYEFLQHPRPCLFANAHGVDWRDDPNYLCWTAGPVFTEARELGPALEQAVATHDAYRARQEEIFAYTIETAPTPPSQRAADAIAAFLSRPHRAR